MNSSVDIAGVIDTGLWAAYQKFFAALGALAVVFDGFDIQILGFAIPSLMKEWNLARPAFGPVLALGLGGMAVGSPLAGYMGDRWGRRPALLACITLFGAATLATSFADSLASLAVLRFVTGLGMGGAVPNASALVAEFTPLRQRPLAVKLTMVCIPLGGMLCGVIAAQVLPAMGWRALYRLGGAVPLACAGFQWLALPESPRFLAQNSRNWPSLERLLRRMGRAVPMGSAFHDSIERGPRDRASIRVLLGSALGRDTAGLWLAFLFCLGGGVYLVFSWLPAMLAAQGVDVASASRALAVYNMGGVAGVLIWAGLVAWFGSRGPLLAGSLASAASALAILFAGSQADASQTVLFAFLAVNGLLTNAVQTSLYALAAHMYPTSVRSSGIAYAAAIGRLGGVGSSLGGAAIIAMGSGAYWGAMAASMAIAFAGLVVVRNHIPGRSSGEQRRQ